VLPAPRSSVRNGPGVSPARRVMRRGHGSRNIQNYRLGLLLHCRITWQHHTAKPRRRRLPHLAP